MRESRGPNAGKRRAAGGKTRQGFGGEGQGAGGAGGWRGERKRVCACVCVVCVWGGDKERGKERERTRKKTKDSLDALSNSLILLYTAYIHTHTHTHTRTHTHTYTHKHTHTHTRTHKNSLVPFVILLSPSFLSRRFPLSLPPPLSYQRALGLISKGAGALEAVADEALPEPAGARVALFPAHGQSGEERRWSAPRADLPQRAGVRDNRAIRDANEKHTHTHTHRERERERERRIERGGETVE